MKRIMISKTILSAHLSKCSLLIAFILLFLADPTIAQEKLMVENKTWLVNLPVSAKN